MESALTIVQPVTLIGCGLLFVAYPLLAGLLYGRVWKTALLWIAALAIAVGCVIVGIYIAKPGSGWVVNPSRLLFQFIYIYVSTAVMSFAIGIGVRRILSRR